MFKTKRCTIQSLTKSDYPDVIKLYENDKVRKYLGGVRQFSEKAFHDMLGAGSDSYYWSVREKQSNAFIGVVSLSPHHDGSHLELSYQLLPLWWGAGYATEVVRVILKFAFHNLKLAKVVAETQIANKPSCRLLEKVGMTLDRTVMRFGAMQAIYSMESNHPQ